MQETQILTMDQEDPLENEMETNSWILAWRIPWSEEPGRPQSIGSQRVGHDWATNISTLQTVISSHAPSSCVSTCKMAGGLCSKAWWLSRQRCQTLISSLESLSVQVYALPGFTAVSPAPGSTELCPHSPWSHQVGFHIHSPTSLKQSLSWVNTQTALSPIIQRSLLPSGDRINSVWNFVVVFNKQ